jgi:hypothetical protein
MTVYQNAAECNHCHEIVVSTSRLTSDSCGCGNVRLSGAIYFISTLIKYPNSTTELTLTNLSTQDEISERLLWLGNDNDIVIFRELETRKLEAIKTHIAHLDENYRRVLRKELRMRKISYFLENKNEI